MRILLEPGTWICEYSLLSGLWWTIPVFGKEGSHLLTRILSRIPQAYCSVTCRDWNAEVSDLPQDTSIWPYHGARLSFYPNGNSLLLLVLLNKVCRVREATKFFLHGLREHCPTRLLL